ncbi:hypothetical protein P2H44_02050 [Albimonas sp. CAU 1670]|uniref:hypothetical protein n=1 Tax=Albimonas sp. CAU 1670 TaxID=3032599 RepID=UPI0023DC5D32|nr:hypothetical protein [Albimonas sp. CAU 1670]MDF2231325.1 hypothetical protein [Albimonas sp. CAU 1670]
MPRVAPSSDPLRGRPAAVAPLDPGGEPPVSPRARAAARAGLLALGLIAGLGGPTAALVGAADPRTPGAPVLAVAPPWVDVDALVLRAQGREVSPIRAPMAALATGAGPDFPQRLLAAGAWFVLDGRRLAQFCGAAG